MPLQVLDLVRALDVTVVAALHDVNLAAVYCDVVFVMSAGALVAAGPVATVLTPGLIEAVFEVDVEAGRRAADGRPYFLFSPARTTARAVMGGPVDGRL
jgi:iron complex transport system ATP-binding protein